MQNSFKSILDGVMLKEGSSCSLLSQDGLASCQPIIMNTTGTCLKGLNLSFFPPNESKERNNSTYQRGKTPVVLLPRQKCLLDTAREGLPLCWAVGWVSVSIPYQSIASTHLYLHLSSGTRALGQIPSTCAFFITELDQLLLPAS